MLKITIAGTAGTGKTTVANFIGEALRTAGLEVCVTDDMASSLKCMAGGCGTDAAMKALRQRGTAVDIETLQVSE